jgi:hypothetical protein
VKSVIPIISVSVVLLVSALSQSLAAEDASIDKLLSKLPPQFERRELFQKQTHTVKIDDAVTDEEQIHPQYPIDSRVALL